MFLINHDHIVISDSQLFELHLRGDRVGTKYEDRIILINDSAQIFIVDLCLSKRLGIHCTFQSNRLGSIDYKNY